MSAAQQIMILFNQDLDSSTVRPDLEKFIKNKQTAAHTTAATVAIPATSLYTVCIAFLAVSKIPAANAGDAETAINTTAKNATTPKYYLLYHNVKIMQM